MFTRKGYYTVEKDGELLTKDDGSPAQAEDVLNAADYAEADGRGGIYTIHQPDMEVDMPKMNIPGYATSPGLDTVPDAFTFTDLTEQPVNTLDIESNDIQIVGIDVGVVLPCTVNAGEYRKNGGLWTSAPGTVILDDIIRLRQDSSPDFSDPSNCVFTAGVQSDTWTIITVAIDNSPDLFVLVDQINAPLNDWIEGTPVTVSGMDALATAIASVDNNQLKKNSDPFNTTPVVVANGDIVTPRIFASGLNSTESAPQTLTIGDKSDDWTATTLAAAGDWNLPSANYLPAYNPLYVTYPRTDTSGHARHFWAHSGFEYRIPIGVQGGAYPYKYEITSGPAGASIGETMDIDGEGVHTPGTYYGVIRWTPGLPERSVSFTVTITDQDGDSIQVTWNVAVDDSKFTFVDSKTSTSGVGTIGDPLKLWDDWYIAADDNTYQDNIIVFRGGGPRYQPFAVFENTSVCQGSYAGAYTELDAGHSICLIGYPDEMPVFDMQKCAIKSDGGFDRNCNGWFIGEIRFEDGNTGPSYGGGWSNTWCFRMRGHSRSLCFFRNEFDNMQGGTDNRGSSGGPCSDSGDFNDNSDNSAVIWYEPSFNTGNDEGYNVYMMGNTFSNVNKGGGNGSIWDVYYTQYMLVERNATTVNCNTTWGWWLKVHRANGCFRGNNIASGRGFVSGWAGMSHIFDTHPLGHQDNEWCYNFIGVGYGAGQWDVEFAWNSDGTNDHLHTNNAIYRNSFIRGGLNLLDNTGGKPPFKVDANIIESNDTNYNNNVSDGDILETYPNLVALGTSTPKIYTNGTGVLVEPYRSGDIPGGWLGKVGHQIKG